MKQFLRYHPIFCLTLLLIVAANLFFAGTACGQVIIGGTPMRLSINGPSQACDGVPVIYSVGETGGSCTDRTWDAGDGIITPSGNQDGTEVSIVWYGAGSRQVRVSADCVSDDNFPSTPSNYLNVSVVTPPSNQVISRMGYFYNDVSPLGASTSLCPQNNIQLVPPAGATSCVWRSNHVNASNNSAVIPTGSDGRATVHGSDGSQQVTLTYQLVGAAACITPLTLAVNVSPLAHTPVVTSPERFDTGTVTLTIQGYDPAYTYTWYEYEDATNATRAPLNHLGGGVYQTPTLSESRTYYLTITSCEEGYRQPIPVVVRRVRITVDGQAPTASVALKYGSGLTLQADPGTSGPYTWLLNGQVIAGASTGPQLAVFEVGTYTVRIAGSGSSYESRPVVVVAPLAGQTVNGQPLTYANELTVLKPNVTDPQQLIHLSATERRQTATYANGFGQPIQQVAVQAGPAQEDIVQHFGYAGPSTTATTLLPFPVPTTAKTPGTYEADPFNKLTDYYDSRGELPSSTAFAEASPLGRPLRQTQTGLAWDGHDTRMSYAANTASEVRRWQGFDGRQWYAAGQLAKEISLDPDDRRTEVFKDQLGRVVLQRKVDGTQNFDTYTVYADAGYVQLVIPPAAVQALTSAGQWNIQDAGFKDRWLYQYTYDDRGRVVERKFPGAAPVYLVYDAFDRPILVQDGNHRAASGGQWLFTKFDAQNRPVVEGIWQDGRSRTAVQAAADAFVPTQEYEIRNAGTYTTGNTFPALQDGVGGAVLLSLSFYDDYDLNADGSPDYVLRTEPRLSLAERPVPTTQTQGLTTITRRRVVLGAYGGWLTTAMFYDQYGNVVQKQSNNLLQTSASLLDVTTLVYRDQGFVPQILRSVKMQDYGAAFPAVVRNRFTYDPAGHLLQTWQQHEFKGTVEPEILLSSNRYQGLGELTQKKLHSRDKGTTFLQTEDFAYNLHGQLQSINSSNYLLVSNPENDLFALDIVREQSDGGNTPRYDGGISAVSWVAHNAAQTNQPERQRTYRFAYDGLGRLNEATYAARTGPLASWNNEVGAYDEKNITYDANGNLLSIERWTQQSASAPKVQIDDLYMSYGSNYGATPTSGNKLLGVYDYALDNRGFTLNADNNWLDYSYDANGSLTHDGNKGVDYVYNTLNKVAQQTVGLGDMVTTYDASGTVLRKVTTAATVKTETYVDGFVYESSATFSPSTAALRSVPTPEGRAIVMQDTDTKLAYEYHLRDHLGNLRVAFRAQASTEDLQLSSESADEQGPYPKFENVMTTRSQDTPAYHRDYVASVTNATAGPAISVPVANGDHLQVRVFCKTPNGIQYRTSGAQPLPALPLPVVALAPTLVPTIALPAPDGRPATRFTPSLQLSVTGLLSAWTTKAAVRKASLAARPNPPIYTPRNAYLAWTLLNAQGQAVRAGTQLVPVTTDGLWHQVDLSLDIDLTSEEARTGTLRLQEVNDGSQPVYFDLLTITHPKDQVLVSQENHYYPFGMALSGVAVNTTAQPQGSKAQFNDGSELQDELLGSEQGIYSTFYRNYDPATGRFQSVDPMADKYAAGSPYAFSFNDPVNFNDPYGDDPPETYMQAVNQMYGEGWYEQNGRGGTNADFYGNSAFGPAMGTYLPGTSIGGNYDDNLLGRAAAKLLNGHYDVGWGITFRGKTEVRDEQGNLGNPLKWSYTIAIPSSHTITPFQVGWEWLTGDGPRHRDFTNGDLFTEMLRKHEHIEHVRAIIRNNIASGGVRTGNEPYNLGGLKGMPLYLRDYSTLLTAGHTGNLAVTYLGGYGLTWTVLGIRGNSADVLFKVTNGSSIESATHPPVIGYTPWWSDNIGKPLNNYFSEGPLSRTTQTFQWTETIKWR
jgi:RHS repeat-associated protein